MEDEQEAPGLSLPGSRRVLTFRLLAVDLDGTLLDAAGAVHEADREVIATLAAKGIPTTIITGRLYSGTRAIANRVETNGPIACVDGCHVVDAASGTEFFHGGLSGNAATRIREVLAKHDAAAFVFANDQIIHDDQGLAYLAYVRTWSVDHVRAERVVDHPHWSLAQGITALVCVGTEHAIRALEQGLKSALGEAVYSIAFPIHRFEADKVWGMVVRAAGHSKGTALQWLARHHGIRPEEVVAVGDWFNDVPMFEAAGRSFVMGQAPEIVKVAATDRLRADSSTGGGIVEAALRSGLL